MDKKRWVITISVVSLVVLGGVGYLIYNLLEQKSANEEMQQLIELDKLEMENEYQLFANQYNEMKTQINNDSIIAQLDKEQMRTQELLRELREVKSTNAAEISRLKRELATVREVMKDYIAQIDSLNRANRALAEENREVKARYSEATQQISSLATERRALSEKVAIAAQLDATGISVIARTKKGKTAKKVKDVASFAINFTVNKNTAAETGEREIYVRIMKPNNDVLTHGATFAYENRQIEYSIRKVIEYTGEEQAVSVYWDVNEFLSAGEYRVFIFSGGQMIGSTRFSLS